MRGPQSSDLPPPTSSTCGRCGHRFPYLEDVGLEIAEYILQQHSQLCCRSSSQKHQVALWAEASGSSNMDSSPADRLGPLENPTDIVRKRRKYETDMMGRKAILEADPHGRDVTAKSIVCNGCDKTIRLDQRNNYYPGLWVKHRDKCRTRTQPPEKLMTRETAKEVVWGERVDVGGKGKAATRAGTAKPAASLRARTVSPTQGHGLQSSKRPRSWSSLPVVETSTHAVAPGDRFENSPHEGLPHPLKGQDFREGPKPLPTVTVPPMESYASTSRLLHAGEALSSKSRYPPDMTRSRSSSIGSSTPPLSMDSGPDVTYHSAVGRGHGTDTPYSSSWAEDGDGRESVKSDRYWSEAPFAAGPDQWAERGRYRYSTRRELMRVFHQPRNGEVQEELPPASPCPSSDGRSSPGGYVRLRELHGD